MQGNYGFSGWGWDVGFHKVLGMGIVNSNGFQLIWVVWIRVGF